MNFLNHLEYRKPITILAAPVTNIIFSIDAVESTSSMLPTMDIVGRITDKPITPSISINVLFIIRMS